MSDEKLFRLERRFLELSLEMYRHTQGFTVLMRTFPSDKFNEWCDLAKLLETMRKP